MQTFLNSLCSWLATIFLLLLVIAAVIAMGFVVYGMIAWSIDQRKLEKIKREQQKQAEWYVVTVPVAIYEMGKFTSAEKTEYACSNCNKTQDKKTKHCSNCGREMKDE